MSVRLEKQSLYSPTTLYTVIFVITAWLTIALIRYVISTKRPPGFPPGPPTFPGLGNLHQIPLERPFLKFHEWAKEYGDIVGLKLGPGNLVLLNTPRLVRELFDKRGSIYSGRPRNPIACQYVLGGGEDKHAFLFMQNDEILSRARTAIRSHLGPQGLDKVLPIQQAEASVLIQMILNKPDAFMEHISYWSLATPLLVIAGQKLEDRAPDFIHHYHDAQEKWLELLTPGSAPPIDIFPFLKWIPEFMGATWKHKARVVRNHMHTFFASLYTVAKKRQASRNERDPIFESLMEEILRDERAGKRFNELELAFLGGGVLDAGVDTTHATALAFVKILAAYPEILKTVQEEIDNVCQESQSPSAKDLNGLPYLNACLMEVFRWRGAAPNGLPHVLDKDDSFDGFRFPKGTVFLANAYTIHNDEDFYDAPFEFKPDRYLNNVLGAKHEQQVNEKGDSRRATYVFGAGRRICPGEGFARNSVLLAVAKIVWAFDVAAPAPLDLSNENGFKSGLVFCSAPFNVTFALRSEVKRSVIQEDYTRAQQFLRQV